MALSTSAPKELFSLYQRLVCIGVLLAGLVYLVWMDYQQSKIVIQDATLELTDCKINCKLNGSFHHHFLHKEMIFTEQSGEVRQIPYKQIRMLMYTAPQTNE